MNPRLQQRIAQICHWHTGHRTRAVACPASGRCKPDAHPTRPLSPLALLLAGALVGVVVPVAAAQSPLQIRVTVLDAEGTPVAGLTREDFALRLNGVERDILAVEPVAPVVQVVALFEGLAATQRQTSAALTSFISSLDDDSIVDMQSVEGRLDAAIVEAVDDLHARGVSRPVIVMIGQATEIVPSEFQSSQVRGKRQAADLTGDLDQLGRLLAAHGILFHGVAVTEVSLANFQTLAAGTGGRFEVMAAPAGLSETLTGLGQELGTQYLVSYMSEVAAGTGPVLDVRRPGLRVRSAPFAPTH